MGTENRDWRALREAALAYPEATEDHPWGHPAYKVKGKAFLFMSVESEPLSFSVKLPISAEGALAFPFAKPTGYGLGKSGWVSCSFPAGKDAPLALLLDWLDESFRAIAPKRLVARLPARAPEAP